MRKLIFLLVIWLSSGKMMAQDMNCKVDVTYDRIQNVDPKVFEALKKSLNDFVNNHKWTTDNFKSNEKIDCSFLLTLTAKVDEGVYTATLNIQSSRPVFNSTYNSPMMNYVDRDFTFRYEQGQSVQFDDNNIQGVDALSSNLTAIFGYYIYIIAGFDYDSFSLNGGDAYFNKAYNIVSNAPEDARIRGWKSAENSRNRYWLMDEILNPRFSALWPYYYAYHRKGLDMMSAEPDSARKVILEGIPILSKINNDNPSSVLFQLLFNTKSSEFMNVLMQTPVADRKDYINQLCVMDVPNAAKYRSIK